MSASGDPALPAPGAGVAGSPYIVTELAPTGSERDPRGQLPPSW